MAQTLNNGDMRKALIVIFAVVSSSVGYGQEAKEILNDSWKPGKEKVIFGNPVFRHEGINNRSGITNVGFYSLPQLIAEAEKQATLEMWQPEQRTKTLEYYKDSFPNGQLHIFITRFTSEAANPDKFTVILTDSTGTERYREQLKRVAPAQGPRYHYSYCYVAFPTTLHGKVFIFVMDALGGDNARFKFEVVLP